MERAEEYVKDLKFEQFAEVTKTYNAVLRCIEVIGEATKNIPNEVRNKYPEIPWRDMGGMRDKVIHSYFTVDISTIWLVVKEEIPKLKPLLLKVLNDLRKREWWVGKDLRKCESASFRTY